MKQSVLSPIALIFTMLMIPKTNEHDLKKKEKKKEKMSSALLLSAFLAAGACAYCHHQQELWEKPPTPSLRGQSLH